MSGYQYYEIQTADRRLSEKEMRELRSNSTRAVITPSRFTNEYSFGDFKENPDAWMEKYFNGFVYLANWGTHELQLSLPAKLLSRETAAPYGGGDAASVRERDGKVILRYRSEEDTGGDWDEGEGILSSLLQLRTELAKGDFRALYIGWLLNVQYRKLDEKEIEPRVPPNLADLSGPLSDLVEFLRLDGDLLAVASEASPRRPASTVSREDIAAWVETLEPQEKDKLLVRLMMEEDQAIGAQLFARFTRGRAEKGPSLEAARRTVGQLLAAAEAFRDERERAEARQAAEAKERRQREAMPARLKYLDALVGKQAELWKQVEELVMTKLPRNYDRAVQHLIDLRDLACRREAEPGFTRRLALLREAHARKPSFIERLSKKLV